MLKGDFYHILNPIAIVEKGYKCRIGLNAGHDIFKGHFPGQPVVPGVCMMAIVREMLEEITGRKLIMKSTSAIKFLNMIDPARNPEVDMEVRFTSAEDGSVTADGSLSFENVTFFKISKAVYR